jgi:hypothetical protein
MKHKRFSDEQVIGCQSACNPGSDSLSVQLIGLTDRLRLRT